MASLAPQDTSHQCPGNNCTRRVSHDMLACKAGWFKIPKRLRDAVWDAYSYPGPGSSEHMVACAEAVEALRAAGH
jgi:hypothetical protein